MEVTAAPVTPVTPVAAGGVPDRLLRRGKVASALVGGLALVAAGFSVAADLGSTTTTARAATSAAAAPADCLRAFNGSGDPAARQALAVAAGDALVRVRRVDALPGTLMRGRPCAVTVTNRATGARSVWADGLEGRAGFVDLSGYPAAERYGAPGTAADANAQVAADGTLRAR